MAELNDAHVAALTKDISESFALWSQPRYTGPAATRSRPRAALGARARRFLAGAELSGHVFPDTGDFNFETVCGPFYEFVLSDDFDEDEHEACSELVENLFLLRQLETLHHAALSAAKGREFAALRTRDPFFLVAGNHDDLGFIFAGLER